MSQSSLINSGSETGFLNHTFRASPAYSLTYLDQLPSDQKDAFKDLVDVNEFCGLLVPNQDSDGRSAKAICDDTARLLLSLQQAGPLPDNVIQEAGNDFTASLMQLVMDGVLEIKCEGKFVSGAAAYTILNSNNHVSACKGIVGQLSCDALKYAQALDINNAQELVGRLYLYNTQPASLRWRQRFPNSAAVADYLGIGREGENQSLLDESWARVKLDPADDAWFLWRCRQSSLSAKPDRPTYKLYISPTVEFVRDAFHLTLNTLSQMNVPSFKIGKDLQGLLRPDKMVCYFAELEDLQAVAQCLADKLAGIPAQGVPFTAEISGNGLLSWGIDPPRGEEKTESLELESWRLWVINRLVAALLIAKADSDSSLEPWQFALERIRMEGVDVETWAPSESIWHNSDYEEVS